MLAMRTVLIAWLGRGAGRVVADFGRAQRIGDGNRGRPARGDGCENLHHQRDQQDRKKSLVAPPHWPEPSN